MQVVSIRGGLPGADHAAATLGDMRLVRAGDETPPAFRRRVLAEAEALRAPFVVIGGLPE